MPYNKGDFTQQGINGDVSALVRLNEKRVMKVVLSSDDESDNCDISGKVYDLLNGTSYDIGSGVSGNIEITENGENINVAPYATATVNVAGGGGSPILCTFTVVNNSGSEQSMPVTGLQYYVDGYITDSPEIIGDDETVTLKGILNKDVNNEYWYAFINEGTLSNAVNCEMGTGDYEFNLMSVDPTQPSSVTVTLMNNV